MRAIRIVLTTIVAASIGGVLGAGPARAGGGSFFEFDRNPMNVDYLVVGRVVTGEMVAYFSDRELEDVQFYAYLEPVTRANENAYVPARLSPAARPLGPISLGPFDRTQFGYEARATVTFTVPEMAPNQYVIEYCNIPCTEMFGDSSNVDTYVTIVASAVEERLRHRIDRLESKLRSEMWRDDRWERRRISGLTKTVQGPSGLVSDSDMLRAQGQAALRRVAELDGRVERLSARLEESGPPWLAYGLGALALAALAVIVLRTGRKPTEVNVRLVEQSDPTFRSWELMPEDDRDKVSSGAS